MHGRGSTAGVKENVHSLMACVLALTLACPALAVAMPRQSPAPSTVDTDQLPVSVDRIQHQLERKPSISLDLIRPTFRTEVIEKRPSWLGEIDWLGDDARLPHPSGPRWHDEFLNMVTPPQARLYGQANNGDLLQLVATSVVEAVMTRALVSKVRTAAERRRAREVRQEIDDAIAAWKKDRERAQGKN
jgi:hypothetical protein